MKKNIKLLAGSVYSSRNYYYHSWLTRIVFGVYKLEKSELKKCFEILNSLDISNLYTPGGFDFFCVQLWSNVASKRWGNQKDMVTKRNVNYKMQFHTNFDRDTPSVLKEIKEMLC